MARKVEDLDLLMPLLVGPDDLDACILPMPWSDPAAVDVAQLRVAFYTSIAPDSVKPTPEMAKVITDCAKFFEGLGCAVTESHPPGAIEAAEISTTLREGDGNAWQKRLTEKYHTTKPGPDRRFDYPRISAAEFTRLLEERDAWRSQMLGWVKNYDLILCPPSLGPAPVIGSQEANTRVPGSGFTSTYNIAGWPSGVVRAGTSPESMPLGVMLTAQPWRDDVVLAAMFAVEGKIRRLVQTLNLIFCMHSHSLPRIILLAVAVLLTAAFASAKPKIVVVSMGGTIASKASSRMNLNNYGGKDNRVSPQEWLDDVPEVQEIATVSAEDMRQPESTVGGDTFEYLYSIAQRLQELANDPAVDGVVVSHGTNTLAEAAWFMHLTVSTRKPIVFVGSQRPWSGISSDGPLNFYNAVQIAATPAAGGMGVLQMMNETLHGARDVTKTSAYRLETFKSPDTGPLGYADADKVVIYNKPLRRHTSASEFNIATLPPKLPAAEILYAYTESPGYLVDALATHGVKGIIIDGTGAGSPGGTQTDALKAAQEKGIVIVATARTRAGRVQDTPRRREAKIVPGDNLPPEKARILLKLALTKTTDLAEIQRIFDQY